MNNNQQEQRDGEKTKEQSVQNSSQASSNADSRQGAIEQEEDTARLRSEQQSVKDGSGAQE